MGNTYSTTNGQKNEKHLSYEDRMLIQIRLKDRYSLRAIAREFTFSPITISK